MVSKLVLLNDSTQNIFQHVNHFSDSFNKLEDNAGDLIEAVADAKK